VGVAWLDVLKVRRNLVANLSRNCYFRRTKLNYNLSYENLCGVL